MIPPRWQILTVIYTQTDAGMTISTTTDTNVHLWCRITSIKPVQHVVPVIIRGTAFRDDIYQCFVAYEDIEQNEAGDTINHTFTTPGWLPGQIRWLYFWGTVAGVASPSTSPVFSTTRTCLPYLTDISPRWSAAPAIGIVWVGQTFASSTPIDQTHIHLMLHRLGSPGQVIISIRATIKSNGWALPTGEDLLLGNINGNGLVSTPNWAWYKIGFGPAPLLKINTTYAIIIRAPDAVSPYRVGARTWDYNPPYTCGIRIYSGNAGGNWLVIPGEDLNFNLSPKHT